MLTIHLAVLAMPATAQYGNEWIDYAQPYWHFPVSDDGLYRISYEALQQGGFPVGIVNPQQLQVFARGQQVYIAVHGEEDAQLNTGDYIELYAFGNDGWLDAEAYDNLAHVANAHYSLFNDTIHYFITYSTDAALRTDLSTATDFDNYTARNYCMHRSGQEYHAEYLIGKQDANGISLPTYDQGEGWFDYKFPKGATHQKDIPTANAYTGTDAPPATVSTTSAGASLAVGSPNHHLQLGWGSPVNIVVDTMYSGYQLNHLQFNLDAALLGAGSTHIVHRSVDDIGVLSDYNAVSNIDIFYPHTFDFGGQNAFRFALPNAEGESFALLNITNFGNTDARLFVLKNSAATEVTLVLQDGTWQALVPLVQGGGDTELMMLATTMVTDITALTPVTPTGFFTQYAAEPLENAFVIITHPMLWSAATNYAAYRAAPGTDALVVNVEELYMQYAAGIRKCPLAIRRFFDELLGTWPTAPAHLFLLGKSIHEANYSATVGARNDPQKYADNLVPTWGYPGSDVVFTAGLAGTLTEPAIPTGRLAAHSDAQVLEYLNKVIEQEMQPPALWQKNILHFGGGSIASEQQVFRNYLNNYKAIAQDTCMGAHVYSFFKNTQDPVQLTVSDSIQMLINEGVSLLTFFGHASATGFDQNIDSPLSYNNQGKYPLLIGNSCYTGNIHLSESSSTSEHFVLVPDRGVIGFLAKSDLGIPSYLNLFTDNFYREIFAESYGLSIGQCMKEAIVNFQQPGDFYRQNVAQTFALHGDPAVKLYPHAKPDYSIHANSITFLPEQVTNSTGNFEVQVVVNNIGKATNDLVGVELIRHLPDGTDSSFVVNALSVLNQDTIHFNIPTDMLAGGGLNTFDVLVDYPLNAVDELDNSGNNIVLNKSLFISSGQLLPAYPYQFAVIDNSQPMLKATTGNALETEKNYIMQVDTTDTFNSPMMQQTQIISAGGVVQWPMPFAMADSMMVYWRCSADSISPAEGYHWNMSSFQYIAGQQGWSQDHFFQFEKNQMVNLDYDREARLWNFEPLQGNLKCEVYGAANTTYESLATLYQIGLAVQDYGGYGFGTPSLMVAVIDSSTFAPWESNYNGLNPQHDYGNTLVSANARQRTERYFIFQQNDAAQLQGFTDMVTNQVPDGHYLLIYTWQYAQKANWDALAPEVSDAFATLGATDILAAPDSVPFIFFKKMGHEETMQQLVGTAADDHLVLNTPLNGALGSANMQGPLIGPAMEWEKAEWQLSALEETAGDTTRIRLHGITWQGADYMLSDWAETPSVVSDLSLLISAEQFPFLKIEAREKDLVNTTPPQVDAWRILYQHAPECAINAAAVFYASHDTLQQGEQLHFAAGIQNIGTVDMDSLMVRYLVKDGNNQIHKVIYPLQAPLNAGALFVDTVQIATADLSGLCMLQIEVNPKDSLTGVPHQLEQYHWNNFAQYYFVVTGDAINPVLDVTFDGLHLLNEDIVSTQPHIVITLDDENDFFLLNEEADTSNFKIYLTTPSVVAQPVYFSSGLLTWTPATGAANKSRIDYLPSFAEDGMYSLRVQANDKSGNASGDYDYEIKFQVISKASITEVLNYPNPFSTRTQFVFTLTGTEVPDEMKIQIMNVSGDIVREITQDELGPMHIGRNLSSYWWDGRDEYGDLLANGVYLYRVVAKLHGQHIELSPTAASRYFNRGFGKMYLLR
ncbi:MAG: C25 family cysteine peptidase [Flavobacteriales bacterium]